MQKEQKKYSNICKKFMDVNCRNDPKEIDPFLRKETY
jgi:hypothetical protein